MGPYNYPVEEFLEHIAAMRTVAQYETVRRDYAADVALFDVGSDPSFLANALRIQDYFAQIIPDRGRREWINMHFLGAMKWFSESLPEFERVGLATPAPADTPNGCPIIAESVLRAAHQVLILESHSDWKAIPTAKPIIALARKLDGSSV
jgi:hypothetical protein